MLLRFKFLLFTLVLLISQPLVALEPADIKSFDESQFNHDFDLANELIADLSERIYTSKVGSTQLNFFKAQLKMLRNLFKVYDEENEKEIIFWQMTLTNYEKRQKNASIKSTMEEDILYKEQQQHLKKYMLRTLKIEEITKKIDDMMVKISHLNSEVDSKKSERKFQIDYRLTEELLDALNTRIYEVGINRKELNFFKNQLLMVKNLFIIYLKQNQEKIAQWNSKLRDFEEEQTKATMNNLQEGLALDGEYKKHITKYNLLEQKIETLIQRIDYLLYIIVNRRVQFSDKMLFVSEASFFDKLTWIKACNEICSESKQIVVRILNLSLKNGSLLWMEFWFVILLFYCVFSGFIKSLVNKLIRWLGKLDDNINTKYFQKANIIVLFGIVPSHFIYLIVTNFSVPINSRFDTELSALVFTFACSISFSILVFATLMAFFKRYSIIRLLNILIFTIIVFVILMNNNINAYSFSTQFVPFEGDNGVALINLIAASVFTFWGLVMLHVLKKYIAVFETGITYFKSGIVTLQTILVLVPIVVFIGYSNLVVGSLVNCLQTVLIVYYMFLLFYIFKDLFLLISTKIYVYFWMDNNNKEEKNYWHPNTIYWVNVVFIIIFCFFTVVLFALAWGVPPMYISKFFDLILFNPIPVWGNSTFTLYTLLHALILFLICYCITIFLSTVTYINVLKHTSSTSGTKYAIKMIIRYIGFVISIVIFILALGVDGKTMTFILSGLSIGIGFALKNSVSNFFSGIIILLGRQIRAGDWIYFTDHSIEGTVEHIGLHSTRIYRFDHRPVIVPNSVINSESVVNASRMSNRRLKQYIGLRYKDFDVVDKVLCDIREMLKTHPDVDQKCSTLVNLLDGKTDIGSTVEGCYGSYSINFMIYTFIKTKEWKKFKNIQDDIMLKIGDIIRQNGAEIAFPTSNIKLTTDEAGIQ